MATVREVILSNQKKEDGTWNVKIRVTHQRKTNYISTQHYVGAKQLRSDYSIKDPIVFKAVSGVVNNYRSKISDLGPKLETYDLARLVNYLTAKDVISAEKINVIEFGRRKIAELKASNRIGSSCNLRTVVNSLVDFFESEFVPVTEIRANMLIKYEKFLRSKREQIRCDQYKKKYKRTVAGLSDNGLHNHMRDLRTLFNNIRDFYNDEDLDVIIVRHYPFRKYKLVKPTESKKLKLTVDQVKAIRDCEALSESRKELARDLFMLSFYLCGMNAADLFQLQGGDELSERVNYNRSKTRSRRRDNAFISIYIPDVAIPLYQKYIGKLQSRYATQDTLNTALSFGIKAIRKDIKLTELEFYDARHAFGDWARNICRFSKDDVGLALNHKDQTNSVTDFYVSKNWAIIDEVQTAVLTLLN